MQWLPRQSVVNFTCDRASYWRAFAGCGRMAGSTEVELVGELWDASTTVGTHHQELSNGKLSFGERLFEGSYFSPGGWQSVLISQWLSEWTLKYGCLTHACCFQVASSEFHKHLDSHLTPFMTSHIAQRC